MKCASEHDRPADETGCRNKRRTCARLHAASNRVSRRRKNRATRKRPFSLGRKRPRRACDTNHRMPFLRLHDSGLNLDFAIVLKLAAACGLFATKTTSRTSENVPVVRVAGRFDNPHWLS